MAASESKPLSRLGKLELMELIEQLTRDHQELMAKTNKLQEAHTQEILTVRELSDIRDALTQQVMDLTTQLAEVKAKSQAEKDALPMGSFADSLVSVHDIIGRTQQAANEYQARWESLVAEAQQQADEILAKA